MLYTVAKAMDQNVVALHAANRMLDEDADLAQNLIGYLLCIAQWRVGVLLTLARLLRRDVNLMGVIALFPTQTDSLRVSPIKSNIC